MKNLRIAEELIEAAKDLIFASGDDYIYDPDHKKHPSGGYHKTEKGWSKKEEKKEKSTSTSKFNKEYFKNTPAYDNDFSNLAWSEDTPYEFYENVLKYGEDGHKWEIANSYATPTKILDVLAFDKNDAIRLKAIKNENLSSDTIKKVFNKEYKKDKNNIDFFEAIGEHKNAPSDVLSRLIGNPNKEVRRSVAGNPNTSPKDLENLAHYNDDKTILKNIAGNESANEDTLTYLFNNYRNSDIRGELAANDNCPLDIVKTLAKSRDSYVRAGAQGNLERRKRKEQDSQTLKIDLSKLSPEMREKVKDWDAEDIAKFLGWLKEH